MNQKSFWIATAERAVKTFAQALVALFVAGSTVLDLDWSNALAVSGTAALISVLTSIVSSQVGPEGSPSVVPDPQPAIVYIGKHEAPEVPEAPVAPNADGDLGAIG